MEDVEMNFRAARLAFSDQNQIGFFDYVIASHLN